MPRATRVVPGVSADDTVIDTVILDLDQRLARRGTFMGVKGTPIELDLAEPVNLRNGDMLALEGGAFVEVVAQAEPLVEVRAPDLSTLARLAWELGDRHVPVQIFSNRLRVRRDGAIEALLRRLGSKMVAINAPFDPEGGAYVTQPRERHRPGHDHAHGPGHGHHHHHDREHDHDRATDLPKS